MKHLLFLLALPCVAATITLNSTTGDATQHSCRVTGTITGSPADMIVQAWYGNTNGSNYVNNSHPYMTGSIEAGSVGSDTGTFALNIGSINGGLQPATTYYGVVLGYPDHTNAITNASFTSCGSSCGTVSLTISGTNTYIAGDSIGVAGINPFAFYDGTYTVLTSSGSTVTYTQNGGTPGTYVSGGTAQNITRFSNTGEISTAQFSCTTLAGSPYPTAPTVKAPVYPNTAGSEYTIVPMTLSGNNYVVSSTTSHAANAGCAGDPAWSVSGGSTIATVLSTILSAGGWGLVMELPQGTVGFVAALIGNLGWDLPNVAIDPCAANIDDPTHRYNMIRTHQANASDFPPWTAFGQDSNGNLFGGPFRIDQSFTTVATLQAQTPMVGTAYTGGQIFSMTLPSSSSVPVHHWWLSNLAFAANPASSNYYHYLWFGNGEGSAFDIATPPAYNVIDRVNFIANNPATSFSIAAIGGSFGKYNSIIGSYAGGYGFQRSANLGQGLYIQNCSPGPVLVYNDEFDVAGEIIYNEILGNTSCQVLQNLLVQKTTTYEHPSWNQANNAGYGTWDGISRIFRNPVESKGCQFCRYYGMWIDGGFAYQNDGAAFLFTPNATAYSVSSATGAHDLDISTSYLRHVSVLMDVFGQGGVEACCGYAPDPALNTNVYTHGLLAKDIGRYLYQQTGNRGGFNSGYFQSYGVQNHIISNNTFDFANAYLAEGAYFYPFMMQMGDNDILSNGMQVTGNLWFYSQSSNQLAGGGVVASTYVCSQGCATYPVTPTTSGTTNAAQFASAAVGIGPGATVTTTGVWNSNTVIGGNLGATGTIVSLTAANPTVLTLDNNFVTQFFVPGSNITIVGVLGTGCSGLNATFIVSAESGYTITIPFNATGCTYTGSSAYPLWPDLLQSQVTAAIAYMPTGDQWPNPSAGTMASRIAAAGLANYALGDFRLTPTTSNYGGAVGANIQAVIAAVGITTNVAPIAGVTAFQISYTAPDTGACSVDVWTGTGSRTSVIPTRVAYSGAASRNQSITVTGLSAASTYSYQLMCSYAQNQPWFSFQSESSNMVDIGTFTTFASGTRTVSLPVNLPPGATTTTYTLTPLGASALAPVTCSTTPCSVTAVSYGSVAVHQTFTGINLTNDTVIQ